MIQKNGNSRHKKSVIREIFEYSKNALPRSAQKTSLISVSETKRAGSGLRS